MKCDACGRNCTDKKGVSTFGLAISVKDTSLGISVGKSFLKKLLHPYEINRVYNVCFACLLRSMGIKPSKKRAKDHAK